MSGWLDYTNSCEFAFSGAAREGLDSPQKPEGMLLYPNPATDLLQIKVVESGSISIVDVVGRCHLQQQLSASIDLGNLAAGSYSLQHYNAQGKLLEAQILLITR